MEGWSLVGTALSWKALGVSPPPPLGCWQVMGCASFHSYTYSLCWVLRGFSGDTRDPVWSSWTLLHGMSLLNKQDKSVCFRGARAPADPGDVLHWDRSLLRAETSEGMSPYGVRCGHSWPGTAQCERLF